ncbi:MAG TPA: hypothetical protein VN715_21910 [Roseiarcus sp.]|nr:hypothetical protein [Roseiarcus sp.]
MLRYSFTLLLTLFAVLGSESSARADWRPCGNEYDTCDTGSISPHLVRLGGDGKYLIVETEGVQALPCDTHTFGDADIGKGKTCSYVPTPARTTAFRTCAGEGGLCRIGPEPHLVRYGVPGGNGKPGNSGRWFYRIGSGDLRCDNDEFPDIAEGANKRCQVAVQPFTAGKEPLNFKDCGSEYSTCDANEGIEVTLFKYGSDSRWVYRLGTMSKIECSNATFARDPAEGARKHCYYAEFPPTLIGVSGKWVQVGECTNCADGTLKRVLSVGITGSRTNKTSKSWSNEVSVEYEKEISPPLLGEGKLKVTNKFTTGGEESLETSLSRSSSTQMEAACKVDRESRMYQWQIDVNEQCFVTGGGCRSTISTFDIFCAVNPPSQGYRGPVCPPGTATDNLGLKCAR